MTQAMGSDPHSPAMRPLFHSPPTGHARPGDQEAHALAGQAHTWTVGELTQYIKELLDLDETLRDVWLAGELSNYTQAASGHAYFTLKDAEAALGCVMWRAAVQRLGWRPEQGAATLAHGYVSVYPVRGSYQLYVDQLYPAGQGGLHARFEELRERLRAEGLFDEDRKRRLPPFPQVVGIVTSPQAAALRDVLNILRRRYPLLQVLLVPSLVQGDQAPPQIVAALQALDARDDVDLILLVRGGGSLEELWAFNDERVARAIAACRHPVVCGVGHETDFTIADFVADRRAPTPSAAAEISVPDQADLRERIQEWSDRLDAQVEQHLGRARQALGQQARALERLSPRVRIDVYRQQVDDLSRRAARSLEHALTLRRSGLSGLRARLVSLSPLATLERGYAIVRHEDTGVVVHSVEQVGTADPLVIQVHDGQFRAVTRSKDGGNSTD